MTFARKAVLACALVIALALAAVACTGPTLIVQQYAGPVRPREIIATLRVNGRDSVQLLTLDEQDVAVPIAEDSRLHIEMLPGRHFVVVTDKRDPFHRGDQVVFHGEPGSVYRVVTTAGAPPRVWEVDRDSDAPLRDVTIDRATSTSTSTSDAGAADAQAE